jgi:hypothetical protein
MLLALLACSDLPTEVTSAGSDVASPAALVTFRTPPFVGCSPPAVQPGGALYQVCFPAAWNGDAVIWAHGYVGVHEPLAVPDDAIGGTPVAAIVTSLGYAYATTSYRRNGLAADVAVQDLEELAGILDALASPRYTLLVGASEGGLSTALALEKPATAFDGGLAACGPVGSFRGQINWFGDFRAVFDVLFPGVLPGNATTVPQFVRDQWESTWTPAILAALAANPARTKELLSVTNVPTDAADPTTVAQSVIGILWYNVFGADDAVARLGGSPFDNRLRWYRGSSNDFLLNLRVRRYAASPAALAALGAFETSGRLRRPTQALHTTGDPIIPYWQQPLYQGKVLLAGSGLRLIALPAKRWGHCSFTVEEALVSFALLVLRVTGGNLIASADALPADVAPDRFVARARAAGADPVLVPDATWSAWSRRSFNEEIAR